MTRRDSSRPQGQHLDDHRRRQRLDALCPLIELRQPCRQRRIVEFAHARFHRRGLRHITPIAPQMHLLPKRPGGQIQIIHKRITAEVSLPNFAARASPARRITNSPSPLSLAEA